MVDIVVPPRPVLKTIPNVELVKVGTWTISTGVWTVTSSDLYAAVAALDSPAIRRPVLKLGHTDPRFNGEPAVGWVDDLRVSDDGSTLVGDYKGVPEWLATVFASAYPDRSIEGEYGFVDQTGREHPFILTAVALLGVTAPGVGTLSSLQDIAALYGVSAAETQKPSGSAFKMPVTREGTPMPQAIKVAASQSIEDVRRTFYEGPAADNWWWIEELYVDPPEVIAVDDETGNLYRVPYTAGDTGVTWGEPEQVKREYVAASGQTAVASWGSRAESRPQSPAAAVGDNQEEGTSMQFDETQTAELLTLLSLGDNATAPDVITALTALVDTATTTASAGGGDNGETVAASTLGVDQIRASAATKGLTVVDAATFDSVRDQAAAGAAAQEQLARQDRESKVGAAIRAGKIPTSRREHWLTAIEADPGMAEVLASQPDNLVPVAEIGHDGDQVGAAADVTESDVYQNWSF
ncbi:phage protease [Dietzia alimentaria]|uniref:phage protease n=1 Tax=Dietzia alimentaria TaxID=665550 RepID=UPI00029ACCB6|nr:phage protease [Dietzia alimentaria]